MDIFWLGNKPPPEDLGINVVDSLDGVCENALIFIDDQSCIQWKDIRAQRVYIVSDLPISSPLPEQVIGVIPRDTVVIKAISTLYSEMRESYDLGDRLIKSLNEKELAIAEKQKIILRDSKRHNAIIKNATDLIFLLGPTGKIMFCNDTLVKYVDNESMSLIGKSFVEYVMDDDKKSLLEMVRKGFQKGAPSRTEVRLHVAEGRIGIFSLMSTPLIEDGHIYALSVIGRDITDIRSMQHRLSLQAKDLAHMINGLSHELRNPLMVIGAYINRIEKEDGGKKNNSKRNRALSGIHSSIKRIEDMIVRIEQYENMVNIKTCYSEVALVKLVKDALTSYKSPVPVFIDADEDIMAFSDYDHIRTAFLCILENAVETQTSEIRINLSKDQGYAYICIRDYGDGVKDDLETISAPFFSTDPMKTGLGLTEARILMAKIGSQIQMIPHANPGAVFILKILLDRRMPCRQQS
jgi:PAS domain S-box-containing protein